MGPSEVLQIHPLGQILGGADAACHCFPLSNATPSRRAPRPAVEARRKEVCEPAATHTRCDDIEFAGRVAAFPRKYSQGRRPLGANLAAVAGGVAEIYPGIDGDQPMPC